MNWEIQIKTNTTNNTFNLKRLQLKEEIQSNRNIYILYIFPNIETLYLIAYKELGVDNKIF